MSCAFTNGISRNYKIEISLVGIFFGECKQLIINKCLTYLKWYENYSEDVVYDTTWTVRKFFVWKMGNAMENRGSGIYI